MGYAPSGNRKAFERARPNVDALLEVAANKSQVRLAFQILDNEWLPQSDPANNGLARVTVIFCEWKSFAAHRAQ